MLLSHTLQFAVLLATFTNLTQHTLYLCWRQRRHLKTHWERWGPGYLVGLSTMCIMVQPTYLVLRVAHKAPRLLQHDFMQITRQMCTILGYVLLLIGIVWATNLYQKLRALCGSRAQASDDV